MAAEFIGLENITQNLEKFEFDAIGVYDKKLEKFKRIIAEGETESDLILAFTEWCERMLFSNPTNFKTNTIHSAGKNDIEIYSILMHHNICCSVWQLSSIP